jgi:MotA/TolQ/ExbB proton channel family
MRGTIAALSTSGTNAGTRADATRQWSRIYGRGMTTIPVKSGPKAETRSVTFGFAAVAHTRAVRLLNAAIDTREVASANATRLAVLSFDGFQLASRQFVRTLLPILPLLGFLGTVIGLAKAISELPRGLTESADHAFDISGSLAGLAVKFETTLLGLLASMISSLSLNFLEKREAELSAACMLVVKAAGESDV